jgi:hypothetical protein
MYVYEAYNLGIQSEFPCPELLPSDRSPDVTIRFAPLSDARQPRSNGGDFFIGSVEEFGTFSVSHGCEICIDPEPGIELAVLRPLIFGPLFSILLRQRGRLVLHASSVEIDGVAVAFMGASGWGKSTLAEYFYARGYRLLTDDVMAIDLDGSQPIAIPSFPQIKLMPDSATAIGHAPDSLPLLNERAIKRAHHVSAGFCAAPLPLKRLYILEIGDRAEIAPISSQETFVELVRHSRVMGLLDSPEFASIHLHQCTALIKQVPTYRLRRQRSFAELSELVALIERDLAPCYA